MPAIVTNDHRIVAADYFQNDLQRIPTYVFIGGTSPWTDESLPPEVNDTTQDKLFIYDELIGAKRIQTANILSVLPRIDWAQTNVYDEYNDSVNLIDDNNPETGEPYKFYVITDEFNVYKCISNNDRATSETKPSGTTINTFQTPDGYIWKYMYTVRSTDAFEYMTPSWIPCYSLYSNDGSNQWLVKQAAIPLSINHIIVTDGGANYTSANPPTVNITGNGTGATAVAQVDDVSGTVTKIIITDAGANYSSASINIATNVSGIGATATPIISPISGHGFDARSELGAIYKMINVTFEGEEGGVIPTGIDYRKAGIVSVPTLSGDTGVILSVADANLYAPGETIVGQTSTATGTIISVDINKRYIYVNNIIGSFSQNENVESQTYNTTQVFDVFTDQKMPATTSVVSAIDIEKFSGQILYASTREKISRGLNQQESIRFVISF